MTSNMRCEDCGKYIIPGQGKWVGDKRLHKSPELCDKARKTSAVASRRFSKRSKATE